MTIAFYLLLAAPLSISLCKCYLFCKRTGEELGVSETGQSVTVVNEKEKCKHTVIIGDALVSCILIAHF